MSNAVLGLLSDPCVLFFINWTPRKGAACLRCTKVGQSSGHLDLSSRPNGSTFFSPHSSSPSSSRAATRCYTDCSLVPTDPFLAPFLYHLLCTMAAEAPKLPLSVRKDVRDNEEKKAKLLSEATAVVGSPVTFDFEMQSVYASLVDSSYQARLVPVSLAYLENVVQAIGKSYKDEMVKKDLDEAWTTHNIAVLVVSDQELEAMKADASTIGGSYFRLRLHNAELQVVSSAQYFNSNLSDIAALDLTPLASHASAQSSAASPGAAEELPLEIRKNMRDIRTAVDESLQQIRKLKGLHDASFDLEGHTRSCYAKLKHTTDRATVFSPETFPLYLDQLNALLTRQWKDDMVSEALLEEWKAPHSIEILPEVDLDKESGKLVKDGRYNAIKLEGGKLQLLQGKGMWRTNLHDISGIDVVKML